MNKLNLIATAVTGLALAASANAQSISKVNGAINVADGQSVESISAVNGTITVGANATVRDEISVVNGTVRVGAGGKLGEVTAVNGQINLGERSTVGEVTTVNGDIVLQKNTTATNDITSVNGGILIHGQSSVAGDVTSVNGAIGLIATKVAGTVENVNGDTTIGINSTAAALHYIKPKGISISLNTTPRKTPRVIIGPNAVVTGNLTFERDVKLYVHSTAKVGTITGATAIPYSTAIAPKN